MSIIYTNTNRRAFKENIVPKPEEQDEWIYDPTLWRRFLAWINLFKLPEYTKKARGVIDTWNGELDRGKSIYDQWIEYILNNYKKNSKTGIKKTISSKLSFGQEKNIGSMIFNDIRVSCLVSGGDGRDSPIIKIEKPTRNKLTYGKDLQENIVNQTSCFPFILGKRDVKDVPKKWRKHLLKNNKFKVYHRLSSIIEEDWFRSKETPKPDFQIFNLPIDTALFMELPLNNEGHADRTALILGNIIQILLYAKAVKIDESIDWDKLIENEKEYIKYLINLDDYILPQTPFEFIQRKNNPFKYYIEIINKKDEFIKLPNGGFIKMEDTKKNSSVQEQLQILFKGGKNNDLSEEDINGLFKKILDSIDGVDYEIDEDLFIWGANPDKVYEALKPELEKHKNKFGGYKLWFSYKDPSKDKELEI